MKGTAKPMYVIVIAIFALFTILFLVYFTFFKAKPALEYGEWKTACGESVKAHALFTFGDLAQQPGIKCSPLGVTIDTDLGSSRGQERAKRKIASVMKDCWDVYGRGRYKLFEKETVYCSPCAIIRFSDKDEGIGHFTEYLATTNVPGKKISYLDYFSGYETAQFRQLIDNPSIYNKEDVRLAQELDSDEVYAVVFTYVKGTREIEEWAQALDTKPAVISGGVGALAGGAATTGLVIFFASNPVGWVSAGVIAAGALIGGGVYAFIEIFKDKPDAWLAKIHLVEWDQRALPDLKCKELPVGYRFE